VKFKVFMLICCVFLFMVCFSGCGKPSEAEKTTEETTTVEKSAAEDTMMEEADTTAGEEEVPTEVMPAE
jgi:ABC-type enterochelin transport system substrate-binding protein